MTVMTIFYYVCASLFIFRMGDLEIGRNIIHA